MDSTRDCDVYVVFCCRLAVNRTGHLDSSGEHSRGPARPNGSIKSFFSKLAKSVPGTRAPSSSTLAAPPPLRARASRIAPTRPSITPHASSSRLASFDTPLVAELRAAATRLPESVPVGSPEDELSSFACQLVIPSDRDSWEYIDQQLNRVIGSERHPDELIAIVRRGPLCINGFCDWLQSCIRDFDVSEVLLERKIQRVIDAVTSW